MLMLGEVPIASSGRKAKQLSMLVGVRMIWHRIDGGVAGASGKAMNGLTAMADLNVL